MSNIYPRDLCQMFLRAVWFIVGNYCWLKSANISLFDDRCQTLLPPSCGANAAARPSLISKLMFYQRNLQNDKDESVRIVRGIWICVLCVTGIIDRWNSAWGNFAWPFNINMIHQFFFVVGTMDGARKNRLPPLWGVRQGFRLVHLLF
jgi:hypothetical protein